MVKWNEIEAGWLILSEHPTSALVRMCGILVLHLPPQRWLLANGRSFFWIPVLSSSVSVTKLFYCLFFILFARLVYILYVALAMIPLPVFLGNEVCVCVCEDLSLDALRVSQEHKSLYVHRGIWYILLISAKGLIGKPTLLLLFVCLSAPP